jgi:PAS domain S-box-containing protein
MKRATARAASRGPLTTEDLDHLARLLDGVPHGAVVVDRGGAVLTLNRRAAEIVRDGFGGAAGAPLASVFPKREHDRLERLLRRALSSSEAPGAELFERAAPNGHPQLLEVTASRVAEIGEPAALVLLDDVTERKRAERRLAAQYAVTSELAGAATVEEAAPHVLGAICEAVGWDVGGMWKADRAEGVLRFVGAWRAGDGDLAEFETLSVKTTFERGVGFPGRVWESGRPAWTANVADERGFVRTKAAARAGLRGALFFPLALGTEVVGVAEFFSREITEPDDELLRMMAAIGSQIAQFLERKDGEEALRESEARKSAVVEAALDCVIGIDNAGRIVEFNPAAEKTFGYRREDVVGRDIAEVIVPPSLRKQHRAGRERYMATGEARILGQRLELPGMRADGSEFPVELTITEVKRPGAPLFIGYLRDITERKRTDAGLAFLAEASTVLASSLEYSDTLKSVARLAVPRLADWCVLFLAGEDGLPERLEVAHADPAKERLVTELSQRFPVARPHPVLDVMESGASQLVPEISGEMLEAAVQSPEHLQVIRDLGFTSSMIVPFRGTTRTLGAIVFVMAESGRRYRKADLALAEEVARRAALAIEQAELYDAERRARAAAEQGGRRLHDLQSVTEAALAHRSLDELLNELLERIRALLEADTAAILVHEDDELVARAAKGLEEAVERGVRIPVGKGFAGRIAAEKRAVTIEDVDHADVLNPLLREKGVKSLLGVPLIVEGDVLGVLHVGTLVPRTFTEDDTRLLQLAADRVALALENAALYQETEQRADAARVLAHVADGVLLLDGDGIVRLWNPAAERITGLPADRVLDRPAAEAIPGWATIRRLVRVALSPAPAAARAETVPIEIEGREVWLSISGVGFAEGTVFAFRDLSEERALDELKTDFVATVSHELRTPLAAVYGAAMTLRRPDVQFEEEHRERLVSIIANEADRLARIVDDILWASQLESGRLQFGIESCDAGAVAAEVVEAAKAHLPKGVSIDLVLPPSLPEVAGDRDKIRQVLVNLIENAVKYSPEGGTVEVHVEPLERRLLVSVRDEGLGIPLTEQQRIFEKFYRLDPNLTRGVGGTGLGLYICRELVRRMNGRLWVASKEGQGSTFFVELPLAEAVR